MERIKNKLDDLIKNAEFLNIQSFKYDGTLYRQYNGVKLIDNWKDYAVFLMVKTKVAEESINWVVNEPTLFLFSKTHFFNATILVRNDQKFVYVNLASPFYIEDNTVKYIDFDLDVKTNLRNDFNVIDWNDFKTNIIKYKYPKELIYKIYDEIDYLYLLFNSKEDFFNERNINQYVEKLKKLKEI
ncbi:DUF402 domain-containing protein [Mycoplasma zalophi]|uniref:DUF402 domain-containing protein n=1 Tax=Mycoplasma zalophi TaxID=191287 RepID=A0ABS6DQ61_9MOLU|nr:DUF402 domain-containing protein [Mycoplasma zalophi]MBU4691235.1 DUF402 domain-containing protein [Mycoplasma zalophi]MBU4691990.1 DUF402 domain-containing protein [Mycoplasma zalophi]